jgi:hypothetical protein
MITPMPRCPDSVFPFIAALGNQMHVGLYLLKCKVSSRHFMRAHRYALPCTAKGKFRRSRLPMRADVLHLNQLNRGNSVFSEKFPDDAFFGHGVKVQKAESFRPRFGSAQGHAGDIDLMPGQQRSDQADDSGPIGIFHNQENAFRFGFEPLVVEAHDAPRLPEKGS